MGQRFDIIGPAQRIDAAGQLRFMLEDQLGVARDAGREFGRQRNGLVEGIGVQRLRAAQHGGQRLVAVVRTILL